jgi:SAM-dependent methyltransferase
MEFLDLVRCPICGHHPLGISGGLYSGSSLGADLKCPSCGQLYPVRNGVPDMLPDSLVHGSKRGQEWKRKLTLQETWSHSQRPIHLEQTRQVGQWLPSLDLTDNYLRLITWNSGHGRILDVGCGAGDRVKHFRRRAYFGVDPLVLCRDYPFPFFRAIAESLPFTDSVFDVILAVEVFDHLLNPNQAMTEILRVLGVGGSLFIFVSDYQDDRVPARSCGQDSSCLIEEDAVHLHSFSETSFKQGLGDSFAEFHIDRVHGYLAVWGWNKT